MSARQGTRDFPRNFIWGTATAAYQVEGCAHEDGKGESIWDEFERVPGAISDQSTAKVTCDQYHRYKEDCSLMADMGMNAYRFSLSWSRLIPDGKGRINEKGVDYYKRLCDELKKNNIDPWMTFYHWDLPLELQKKYGGWESKDVVNFYGEYVDKISRKIKDYCQHFFTFNEFLGCTNGYYNGLIAPGLKVSRKRRNQIRHNVLLAHGTGLAALRSVCPKSRIGIAENPQFLVPVIDVPEHVEAAKLAFREQNAHFLTAVMEGKYMDSYLEKEKDDAPIFSDEEMKLISAPLDFLGLNIYFGKFVRKSDIAPYEIFDADTAPMMSGLPDIFYEPDAVYWGCRMVSELWQPKSIIISENGMRCSEIMNRNGEINDLFRIKFLRGYLTSAARAIREGYPLHGYFHWSLLDNMEWNQGYSARFGLIHVNFNTCKRTKKLSSFWYKQMVSTGKLC